MELRDLKAFVLLGELLHFGQAAQRQHVTQSALSKQIRRLEQALGAPLFERSAGATRLTPLGEVLYGEACEIVSRSERLTRTAREVLDGTRGTLRIGFGVASEQLVPAAVTAFHQRHPDVKVELYDLSTHHQITLLGEGKLDLGFCRLPAPRNWYAQPVLAAHFVLALPAHYPLDATLEWLCEQPLALLRRDKAPSFYDHLMRFLASQSLHVRTVLPVNNFAAGLAQAAAGIAWTLVPSGTVISHAHLQIKALQCEDADWQVGLIAPHAPTTALLRDFCAQVAGMSQTMSDSAQ